MTTLPEPLPGRYGAQPGAGPITPHPATMDLVRSQVGALLTGSAAFDELSGRDRDELRGNMVKVAAYAAELMRDAWYQANRLGQRPVVRRRRVVESAKPTKQKARGYARAMAAADEFRPAAANQVARVTEETLNAIAFPTFVADLIRGSFHAIVDASIQQMEAYGRLLENVSKTVDQFMADNITDAQARDWLVERYPEHLRIEEGRVTPREGADELPAPSWRESFGLNEDVAPDDEDGIEETLVPAARRSLAHSRLRMLSTMVLMGVNRIVVTSGKIKATMGFHIDTTDRAHEERATNLDTRSSASGSFGWGPWSASASVSVSYVRSTRADSDAELNVNADLTGEVEIRFKSDYFPLNRFVDADGMAAISAHTANPSENAPAADAPASGQSASTTDAIQPSYEPPAVSAGLPMLA